MHTYAARDDTIVAVSSPPGRSPRGLLRLSGPTATHILTTLLHPTQPPLSPRTLTPARLNHPPLPALACIFPAPRSYTGQNIAELQTPGHPALLDRLLHLALHAGARLAEPGEFTFRGFLAGRFDLTQAEGIAATIAATSDSQLHAAALLRRGTLATFTAELVDTLANQLALVEAGIDFTDQEDVVPITPSQLDAQLTRLESQLQSLLHRSRSWGTLEALPRVVFVGQPSAGKSTLFNALLGRTRAVIHDAPGTTRDVLAEPLTLIGPRRQPIELMLVDVAGLDTAQAQLDQQIQSAARAAIEHADLLLLIHDPTQPRADAHLPPIPHHAAILHVATKADLPAVTPPSALRVSAATGQGLDELRTAIVHAIGNRGVSVSADMLALQPRHEHALRSALAALRTARDLLAPQRDEHALAHMELVAGHLRCALDELASLGGQISPDDVLGRIFSTFCIGK